MVKLSDYLDYLYNEVIQARKMVDQRSVSLAKEYAKDEYLKFFRVPRFTMPSVKLEIPIKIDELDAETKYNFKMDENSYIDDVNRKIESVNLDRNLSIQPISKEYLRKNNFSEITKELEKRDYRFVKRIDESISRVDFGKGFDRLNSDFIVSDDSDDRIEKKELLSILKETLKNQFTPISAKLNNIFIDPDTTKESDKNKVMVKLNVELVEEGLRIVELTKDGKPFEEVVFE